jgi:hypothetical protein
MSYNSGTEGLSAMMSKIVAESIFAAQESSIFLGGQLIPVIQGAPGSTAIKVPLLAATSAQALTGDSVADDFAATQITATAPLIQADLYAARTVLRDFGGVDPTEVGRVLGNAVTYKFDAACAAKLNSSNFGTPDAAYGTATAGSMDQLFEIAAEIRDHGETGELIGVVSPAIAAVLLKDIGGSSFAGSDLGSQALTNGFIGSMAGIRMFQSSHVVGSGTIFGADALRIGMFSNVSVEAGRRPEAVGTDLVASLAAGVQVIDQTRGIKLA